MLVPPSCAAALAQVDGIRVIKTGIGEGGREGGRTAEVPKTRFGIAKRPQIERKGRDRDRERRRRM